MAIEDLSYQELMGDETKKRRYVATGNTYPHREIFTSWAWHWDPKRRAWIEDNGSYVSDLAVRVIKDLPGVVVTEEPME